MTKEMHINDALKQLNAGKFSFQMSACIADHIAAQSREIEALTTLSDRRKYDIMQRDLHIHLLEKEVTNLKKLLLGSFMPRALLSQAIETATAASVKFHAIDVAPARLWIKEITTRLKAQVKNFAQAGQPAPEFVRSQIRVTMKSIEKLIAEVFERIKAFA